MSYRKGMAAAAILVGGFIWFVAPDLPQDVVTPSLVVEQVAIQTSYFDRVQKYAVNVAVVAHNNLNKQYQAGILRCSLFVEGKLVASAAGVFNGIPEFGNAHGVAESGFIDFKPDSAECNASGAF